MLKQLAKLTVKNSLKSLSKSLVDNTLRDRVTPVAGSVLHCSLFGVEHSGIYVGDNKIVELLGSGNIRLSSPKQFIQGSNALSIYVACEGKSPLGNLAIAKRALGEVGNVRKYNVILNNCHLFSYGCLTGKCNSNNTMFQSLEDALKLQVKSKHTFNWRIWHPDYYE